MMYVENYNVDMSQGEINLTFFAVFVALFQFTRMGCSLIVTQSLGPIISTIMYMFKDIIVFLAIWVIVLHVFIFSGIFMFKDCEDLRDYHKAQAYWF